MMDGFHEFDEAYSGDSVSLKGSHNSPPLRRRKTLQQRFNRCLGNAIVMPTVGLVYATVVADGIRILMPIFRRKLYSLPVPGAGLTRNYDGWDRVDLAIIVSILLFVVVTWVWSKVFLQLQHTGSFAAVRDRSPVVLPLLMVLASVMVIADAGIFYVGLSSQSAGGWSDTPDWTVPAATLMYCCGLAIIGWWHSDYSSDSSTIV